jgi:tetratricopeptide (TPR) repeat protein
MYRQFIFILLILCTNFCFAQAIKKGDSLLQQGAYKEAIIFYTDFINHTTAKSLDIGNAHLRKGVCIYKLNEQKLALQSYFTALEIFSFIKNKERIGAASKNIFDVYFNSNQLKFAEKYANDAFAIYEELKDSARINEILNDLGRIEQIKENYFAAIAIHLEALKKFKQVSSPSILFAHYLNLGLNYQQLKKDSCLYFFKKAEGIAIDEEDSTLLGIVNNNLGLYYKTKKEYKKAIAYLTNIPSLEDCDTVLIKAVYQNLTDIYDSIGDYKMAYHFAIKERKIEDKLFDHESNKRLMELAEKYESDKKDAQIKTQTLENKLKTRNIILSLIGLGIVSLLAAVAYYNFRKKKKINQLLEQQKSEILLLNDTLDKSNQTKTQLFSIISHDLRTPVSNLYTYLQLQQLQEQKEGMQEVSQQTEQLLETLEDILVWSKTQLHQFIPIKEFISLQTITSQIVLLVDTEVKGKQLTIDNNIQEKDFLKTDANMLGVVMRNILFNAVHYAQNNSTISINVQHTKEAIILYIENETIEPTQVVLDKLNSNTMDSSKKGLGNTLINDFAHKLQAKIVYTTTTEKTLKTALIFPQ